MGRKNAVTLLHDAGQPQIENEKIPASREPLLETRDTVVANDDVEPQILQMQADQLGDVVIVLDNQNASGHGAHRLTPVNTMIGLFTRGR